jgi:hypothetical protein
MGDLLTHRPQQQALESAEATAAQDDHPGALGGGEDGPSREVVLDAGRGPGDLVGVELFLEDLVELGTGGGLAVVRVEVARGQLVEQVPCQHDLEGGRMRGRFLGGPAQREPAVGRAVHAHDDAARHS